MLSSIARHVRRAAIPPPSVVSARGFHVQWNLSPAGYRAEETLAKDAELHPMDADKQTSLLKQVNTHNPSKVIERVESGMYANNEATLREYIRALYKENKLDQLKFSNILAAPNVMQNTQSGFNAPMRVQYVRNKWENFAIMGALAGVLLFVWTLEHGRETPAAIFNMTSAHKQISDMTIKFSDVMGADEAKSELQEIVEYLRNPDRFAQIGAKLPKGVLMCGPPGTGKTLMARAMAGEAGVPFLYAAGSAFDEVYVGVGSKRVRQLFQEAAQNAPCIVFIDEIDAVGTSRENSNKDGTLQQLLTELDGFGATKGVVVIAATNTPETLDPALVRPGRFDRQVYVPLPDVKGRKQIFDMYLRKVSASESVDSDTLARSTPGFSGADINQLINASAIKAVISGRDKITMDVIDEAKDDILMGRMRKSVIIDDKTRAITAYHEGGHALVAHYTEGADPVHKATIIQRGSALGMVKQLPSGDQLSYNRQQMEARLAVLMAGRAAEDLMYGRMGATSGASSDLKQASKLASKMVREWGFSDKVGLVYVGNKVSSEKELLIEEEIKDLLHTQYENAKKVLINHKEELDTLAKALLDKETLSGDEIRGLLHKA